MEGRFTRIKCLVECSRCANPKYLRRSEAIRHKSQFYFCDKECYEARISEMVNNPEINYNLIQSSLKFWGHDASAMLECYCCGKQKMPLYLLRKTRWTHGWYANRNTIGKVLNYLCSACYHRLYYYLFKEKRNKNKREWYAKALIRYSRQRSQDNICRKHAKLREAVFHILGHTCRICGQFDKRLLQFDHINGGGKKEQRLHRYVNNYLQYLIANPEETKKRIQVLCANCNWLKRYSLPEIMVK